MLISIPIVWIAETVGVIESLDIGEPISTLGYIGMVITLMVVGFFSND